VLIDDAWQIKELRAVLDPDHIIPELYMDAGGRKWRGVEVD
jgi:hypothetical protein